MILFSSKLTISLKEMHDEDIEDEIRDAFRVFDREGHGYISVVDLKDVLTHLGEKLSLEECEVSAEQPEGPVLYEWNIQELLEEADIDRDGNIFYDEFIAMIFKVGFCVAISKTKPMFCFRVPVLRRKDQSTKQEKV